MTTIRGKPKNRIQTKDLKVMKNYKKVTAQTFLNEINRLNKVIDTVYGEETETLYRNELVNIVTMVQTIFDLYDLNLTEIKEYLSKV